MTPARTLSIVTLIGLLVGCGGGGGDPSAPEFTYVALFNISSAEPSLLTTLTTGVGGAESGYDEITRDDDRITIAGLTGTINDTHDSVAFDAGGTATLTEGSTDYVAFFSPTPNSGDPFVGIIGVRTKAGDLPGGAPECADIDGARVVILSGTALYDLQGAVSATVDFGSGLVNITLNALNGTIEDGGSSPVDDVATIEIIASARSRMPGRRAR